jgi:hypothetical protein
VANSYDSRRTTILFTAGTEVAGVRNITIQVVDRLDRRPIKGRWLIRLWVTNAEGGAPTTSQTLAVVTGTLIANTSNSILEAATDDTGALVFSLELAIAGTRYVYVANLEELEESGELIGVGAGGASVDGWQFDTLENSDHAMLTWE